MFTVALSSVTKLWDQTRCLSTNEWIKKIWYTFTQRVLFNCKEEWYYTICKKMYGTGYHNIKWNKPDPKRQILHVFSHMWNLDWKKKIQT
jgi:hypothetical protein